MIFLQQQQKNKVIVFFAGFSSEPALFAHLCAQNNEADILLVYNYQDLDFDYSVLQDYQEIYVLAWSMGVAVASIILSPSKLEQQDLVEHKLPIKYAVAIAGSPLPLEHNYGIDKRAFRLTLKTLCAESMEGFRYNLNPQFADFNLNLQRDLSSLKNELSFLYEYFKDYSQGSDFSFDKAIVCTQDKIFKAENLQAVYRDQRPNTKILNCAEEHYSPKLFTDYLTSLKLYA